MLEQASQRIELRPYNRLSRSLVSSETLVHVHDGVLALEAVPAGGRRQILDFFMPGDAIPASVGVTSPGFFLRALTKATLERRSSAATEGTSQSTLEATTLLGEVWSHLMRRNVHQIMIGQLDTQSRVSSFLLMLALRCCRTHRGNLLLPLPMSRNDVADYLVMNPDTLSRIMMRLEALQIIRRLNRHSVKLIDDQKLGQLSPIRPLLLTTFGSSIQARRDATEFSCLAPCAAQASTTLMAVAGTDVRKSHLNRRAGPIVIAVRRLPPDQSRHECKSRNRFPATSSADSDVRQQSSVARQYVCPFSGDGALDHSPLRSSAFAGRDS